MVLLQSMSVGKPVIISRTPTTEEYGEHGRTLYFVEYGAEPAMKEAIRLMSADADLRSRIGTAARRYYEERHTVSAYTNGVLSTVERMLTSQVDSAVAASA